MLTKEEMKQTIENEIIVDCYDEYEVSMGWYYYMEETLKFPFSNIHYSQLSQIKADDETPQAFALWEYWKRN
jgi:hypothetical protein